MASLDEEKPRPSARYSQSSVHDEGRGTPLDEGRYGAPMGDPDDSSSARRRVLERRRAASRRVRARRRRCTLGVSLLALVALALALLAAALLGGGRSRAHARQANDRRSSSGGNAR